MTNDELIVMVKNYLNKIKLKYSDQEMIVVFEEAGKDRDGNIRPFYSVSFWVGPLGLEHKLFFMIIDATTYELLYIMRPHGYLEIEK